MRPPRDRRQIDFPLAQELHRVAEGDALGFHHPVDRAAADLAAKAVPQVLGRRHDQGCLPVLVERAVAVQILALALQLDAGRFHQPLDRHLRFQPLQLFGWDTGHFGGLPKNLSRGWGTK